MSRRGAGFEEHLAACGRAGDRTPVQLDGPYFRIPLSTVGPKPVNGSLPVVIGAVARPAVERAARIGDGFVTGVRDWDTSRTEIGWYRAAGGTGQVVLRVMPPVEDTPDLAEDFARIVLEDLKRAADLGADEIHWEPGLTGIAPDRQIEALEAPAAKLA
ncbi:LLM class flavin-dependent oxidoreductase [Streptomyces sp. A3M-1-3]|nr:LLM class flavin-dependent oxidoreductase [Streptomyces sp. A3M-1-3]